MCLYTPQGLQAPKKNSKGPAHGTKTSTRSNSSHRGRSALPRGIIINQPTPIPPPQAIYPQQPRIELVGDGESTNIYLPGPPQPTISQPPNQRGNQQGIGQGQGQNNERRRSSMLVAEVKKAMDLAKRVGEAARRTSASSFGRGQDYERRRDLGRERGRLEELENDRLREQEREHERGMERLERGRTRDRSRERRSSRRSSRNRREMRRQVRTPSSNRSRSRERRSETRTAVETKEPREPKVVDEEARVMATHAQNLAGGLVRDKDIKKEAKKLFIELEKKEERLTDRLLSRYGAGGPLTPPSPPPLARGRFKDWDGDRGRERDWKEGVSWAPWNAQSYNANYVLGPSPPPVPAAAQTYGNNSGVIRNANNWNGNENGNRRGNGDTHTSGGSRRGRGNSRSRSRERRHVGSNHIHVHTAPLVQGPQISTNTAGSAGAYGHIPSMSAASDLAGQSRSSLSDPARGIARLLERDINASGYGTGGMRSSYGAAMPQIHSRTMRGSAPIYGISVFAPSHMPVQPMPVQPMRVPVGEREWQRARVYNTTNDSGMGGMMY